MCGGVMSQVDPALIKKMFKAMEFKHQDKYRCTYISGPMRFLPVAYNNTNKKTSEKSVSQCNDSGGTCGNINEKKNRNNDGDNDRDQDQRRRSKRINKSNNNDKDNRSVSSHEQYKNNSIEESKSNFDENEDNQSANENKDCGVIIECMQWGMHRPGHTDLVINGRFEELVHKPMF